MTVKYSITPGQKFTEEEKEEIRNAKKMEPQFDEDCPELSETMLKSLKAAVRNRNRAMAEQINSSNEQYMNSRRL